MALSISGKFNNIAGRIKAKISKRFEPKGINKYIVQLKKDNIILKNLSTWKGISEEDMYWHFKRMYDDGIVAKLKSQKQRIIIIKDTGASAATVLHAIEIAFSIMQGNSGSLPSRYIKVQSIQSPEFVTYVSRGPYDTGEPGLLPFPKESIKLSKINMYVSSKDDFSIYSPKKGKILFGINCRSLIGPMTSSDIEIEGVCLTANILDIKYGNYFAEYYRRQFDHVHDMLFSYFQIGSIYYDQNFICSSMKIRDQKGLARLYSEGVSTERIINNIKFLKKTYLRIPHEIITKSIFLHDIGKAIPEEEASHAEISAELIEQYLHLQQKWSLGMDQMSQRIAINTIKHHLILGGISLGEYSLVCLYDIFQEEEIKKIIASGKINEFIDNLTLLTACDIAGRVEYTPLNRRIEDLVFISQFLKSNLSKILKKDKASKEYYMDEEGKDRFHWELSRLAEMTSELRLCRYLSGQDENRDVNTNNGYEFYRKKLRDALVNISWQDRDTLIKFFALLKSFPYSGAILNRILWKNQENAETGEKVKGPEISKNAINFLVDLSKEFFSSLSEASLEKIEKDKDFVVTANLINRNGEPIQNVADNYGDIKEFVKMINEGKLPQVTFHEDERMVSLSISLTVPWEQNEEAN